MALTEEQIQRYGRQILLRELGGKGQARLLASPVRVLEQSPAIDVAIAYLAAGGTPLWLPGAPLTGFLSGAPPSALSPDAIAAGPPVLTLGSTAAATVRVSGGGIAWQTADTCPACWQRVDLPPAGPPVVVGSAAALITQRWILGRLGEGGALVWNGASLEPRPLARCPAHA